MDYKDKMRSYRLINKLTQKDMADKLGLMQQTYSYYETGRSRLTIVFAKKYFEVTGELLMAEAIPVKDQQMEQLASFISRQDIRILELELQIKQLQKFIESRGFSLKRKGRKPKFAQE